MPGCTVVWFAQHETRLAWRDLLWLISLLLFYWITRLWFFARRGALDDDPVLFALRDPHTGPAGGSQRQTLELAWRCHPPESSSWHATPALSPIVAGKLE